MKVRLLLLALLATAGLFGVGCGSADPEHSTLPHARPADWEGVPALVNSPGRYGY